jgi:hypothetical protein
MGFAPDTASAPRSSIFVVLRRPGSVLRARSTPRCGPSRRAVRRPLRFSRPVVWSSWTPASWIRDRDHRRRIVQCGTPGCVAFACPDRVRPLHNPRPSATSFQPPGSAAGRLKPTTVRRVALNLRGVRSRRQLEHVRRRRPHRDASSKSRPPRACTVTSTPYQAVTAFRTSWPRCVRRRAGGRPRPAEKARAAAASPAAVRGCPVEPPARGLTEPCRRLPSPASRSSPTGQTIRRVVRHAKSPGFVAAPVFGVAARRRPALARQLGRIPQRDRRTRTPAFVVTSFRIQFVPSRHTAPRCDSTPPAIGLGSRIRPPAAWSRSSTPRGGAVLRRSRPLTNLSPRRSAAPATLLPNPCQPLATLTAPPAPPPAPATVRPPLPTIAVLFVCATRGTRVGPGPSSARCPSRPAHARQLGRHSQRDRRTPRARSRRILPPSSCPRRLRHP